MPAIAELLQEGRYRIDQADEPHGSNSVFLAYDTVSETNVVVKEIVVRLNKVTTLSQQEATKAAFQNKATTLTEIRHDSLLKVRDFFSEVGRQFLVLESVDGDDFHTLLEKNERPFALADVVSWADQLLDGLNYLHNLKPALIHKSIDPKNIKLTLDGKVKLFSHGVSDESGGSLAASLTDSNETTRLNYSPLELIWESLDAASQKVIVNSYDDRSERLLKESPDARSDIYALGATLYCLMTGKVPVDPLERSIELLEGNEDPLEAPFTVDPRIAPEISDVVMRAMQIKRENRFDSATIMRQVLKTAVVRVKEREASEAQEMDEAAEFLRNTQQLRAQKPRPEPPVYNEQAQPDLSEVLEQKLREAGQRRRLAEQRAAEAERMPTEQEAERQLLVIAAKAVEVAPAPADERDMLDDDLLGLNFAPVPLAHVSTPPAAEPLPHIAEPEVRAFFDDAPAIYEIKTPETIIPDLVEDPAPGSVAEDSAEIFTSPVEDQLVEPEAVEHLEIESPEPYVHYFEEPLAQLNLVAKADPAQSSYIYESDLQKSALPIPMIAAAAAVLMLVAIGGWMFLGSSFSDSKTIQPQTSPTQNIVAPVETAPQTVVPPVTTQETVVPATQENQIDTPVQTEAVTKPAVKTPAKATKPVADPAKTPVPKKSVTVDDLINDN